MTRSYLLLKALLADNMKTDLVIQALRSAVNRRKPAKGLIHHSDSKNIGASFTGTGACLDNAIIEHP